MPAASPSPSATWSDIGPCSSRRPTRSSGCTTRRCVASGERGRGVRKVVVYELLSLDGVAEDPDQFFADWDDAMDANLAAVIATQDAVILGRRSYDEWARFWPSSRIQPFATFINGVTKYVATSTPLDRDWANTTVLEG